MPTLSIYVNDKIYQHLGKKPSKMGKIWIEERYKEETEKSRGQDCQIRAGA